MAIAFIIQARMGSSRLPDKILLPFFKDKCILDLLIEKLKNIEDAQIILATSVSKQNDILEKFCSTREVNCFRGNEEDVLQRFIDAAEHYGIDKIIRVCSDNPFLELDSIRLLFEKAGNSDADYMSFMVNGSPSIKTHFGFWTEFVTLSALKMAKESTDEPLYHEHVTNYIYSHPEKFNLSWIEGPECLEGRFDIRLTCDTKEDFLNTSRIYNNLCACNPYPSIESLVEYIDKNPEYTITMKKQIKLNSK